MKSSRKKIEEGRCLGIGRDYVPFYTSQEARSIGTSTAIPDPFEHRMVHVLSMTEYYLYWMLRWNDNTEHIREQYLLDTGLLNEVRMKKGLSPVSSTLCYTTDFLVNEKDGGMHAYSVKWKAGDFDSTSAKYRGKMNRFVSMIERQGLERDYWEAQGIDFTIVTMEYINKAFAVNVSTVMGCYNDLFCISPEQKLMYLIAHKYYRVNMTEGYLNPKVLLLSVPFDVEGTFERMREVYGEVDYGD